MSIYRKPTLMEFVNYEIVRRSGEFNMIMEMESAAKEAELDMTNYKNVLDNYQWCLDQWKDCKFKIKEWYIVKSITWKYKYIIDSRTGEISIYNLNDAIDKLSQIRSKYCNMTNEQDWDLEVVE